MATRSHKKQGITFDARSHGRQKVIMANGRSSSSICADKMSNIETVLLVGAGQLGSRHLQGLRSLPNLSNILVVEPFEQSRNLAMQRFTEVGFPKQVELDFFDFEDVGMGADAAIISTTSAGRIGVLEKCLELGVLNVLCEKVLFQSENQLKSAIALQKKFNANIHVNHIYRRIEAFGELRDLCNAKKVDMNVHVGGVGMGCNLIHFLDLFSFITGSEIAELKVETYKPIVQSKREGYVDFGGLAVAHSETEDRCTVHYDSRIDEHAPVISFHAGEKKVVFDENSGKILNLDFLGSEMEMQSPRVSELTGKILMEIEAGQTNMPTLAQCYQANLLMLRQFNAQLFGTYSSETICPIT